MYSVKKSANTADLKLTLPNKNLPAVPHQFILKMLPITNIQLVVYIPVIKGVTLAVGPYSLCFSAILWESSSV